MTRRHFSKLLALTLTGGVLSSCGSSSRASTTVPEKTESAITEISVSSSIQKLEDGFSVVRHKGNDGFDRFLAQGGAASDEEVVQFLVKDLLPGSELTMSVNGSGCSTLAAVSPTGEHFFGRNFDWDTCNALVVISTPENDFASISTVNTDFITHSVSSAASFALKLDTIQTTAALYAPLDGMNEAGFAVSVNMIQDNAAIHQNTGKPALTTTTAVRLLLNKAASVENALNLLEQYDLHSSMGMMVHLAMADKTGRSVVVEYINNEMLVTETPVVTNFYLAEGEKHGIGTQQSHRRYELLTERLAQNKTQTTDEMRDALDSVSKHNFEEYASTEWSAVFHLDSGTAQYYHREDYTIGYQFRIRED